MCCAIISHSFIDSSEACCQRCASSVTARRTISWKGRRACYGAIQSSKQDEEIEIEMTKSHRCLDSQNTNAVAAKEITDNSKNKWKRNTGVWGVVEILWRKKVRNICQVRNHQQTMSGLRHFLRSFLFHHGLVIWYLIRWFYFCLYSFSQGNACELAKIS